MTDREMLELAAKAAGYDYKPQNGALVVGGIPANWNPLEDDGDALWLAVRLGIEIHPDREIAEVITAFCVRRPVLVGLNTAEEFGADEMCATRRAITRAAAEIGRQMP